MFAIVAQWDEHVNSSTNSGWASDFKRNEESSNAAINSCMYI